MKTPPRKNNEDQPAQRRTGPPESPQSNATFPRRTDPPGQSGLANEARPGIGTRRAEPFPGEPGEAPRSKPETESGGTVADRQRSGQEPNDKPLPRDPQEQRSDTWAQEAERDTGASGHLG